MEKSVKVKIQIKHWLGRILFEYESENNTIKETLRNANLSGAVLSGAVLRNANLSGAVLPIFCKWSVSILEGKIKIGCKIKTIEDWDLWFTSTDEFSTKRGSKDFNRIYANYVAVREYSKIMNND